VETKILKGEKSFLIEYKEVVRIYAEIYFLKVEKDYHEILGFCLTPKNRKLDYNWNMQIRYNIEQRRVMLTIHAWVDDERRRIRKSLRRSEGSIDSWDEKTDLNLFNPLGRARKRALSLRLEDFTEMSSLTTK